MTKKTDALDKVKSYYDYQKSIQTSTKDIAYLENQIRALDGVSDKASQSNLASLRNQLAEKQEDFRTDQFNHEIELRQEGYNNLKEDAQKAYEDLTKEISRNTDLQNQIISQMLTSAQANYTSTYKIINQTIKDNGLVMSTTTTDTINKLNTVTSSLGNLGLKYGEIKNPAEQFKDANNTANASIIKTSEAAKDAVKNLNDYTKAQKTSKTVMNNNTSNLAGKSKVTKELPKENIEKDKPKTSSGSKSSSNNSSAIAQKKVANAKEINALNEQITATDKKVNSYYTKLKDAQTKKKASDDKLKTLQAQLKKAKKAADKEKLMRQISTVQQSIGSYQKTIDKYNILYKNEKTRLSELKNKLKAYKYAKGSRYIQKDQIGWTQENGQELVFRRSDGAILTPLGRGDKVFTADMTENLWRMAKAFNKDMIDKNVTDVSKAVTIAPKIDMSNMDNSIHIEGNADQFTVEQIRKISDERINVFEKRVMDGMKLNGFKMRF